MRLSESQKERLINREQQDTATRRYNEFSIRKFFRSVLDSLEDLLLILERLPERQIAKIFKDEDVYRLQAIEEKALYYLDFKPFRYEIPFIKFDDIKKGEIKIGKEDILYSGSAPEHFKPPLMQGYVSKTLLASERSDGSKFKMISEGDTATEIDYKRFDHITSHLSIVNGFFNEAPGLIGNKERDYYYRNLIKTANKRKLNPVALADDGLNRSIQALLKQKIVNLES
jgi:hypothetical protein